MSAIGYQLSAERQIGGGHSFGRKPIAEGRSPRGSIQPKKLAHVAIVLFLTVFGAQVEMQLVDDLDAEVLQPFVPAVGTDVVVDATAGFVVHGRLRQLTS